MKFERLSPLLIVDAIEPSYSFWTERMHFQEIVAVPDNEGKFAFVLLQREDISLMYQTKASVEEDIPSIAESLSRGPSCLYINVSELAAIEAAIDETSIFMPKRKTFYGALEIGIREPAGHLIVFAQAPDRHQ